MRKPQRWGPIKQALKAADTPILTANEPQVFCLLICLPLEARGVGTSTFYWFRNLLTINFRKRFVIKNFERSNHTFLNCGSFIFKLVDVYFYLLNAFIGTHISYCEL